MDIEGRLAGKINLPDIREIAGRAGEDREIRDLLRRLVRSEDRRTSVNTLWTMTHLGPSESAWLSSLRDEMIDMLLAETDTAKKRMLLQLLRAQEYDAENIRTDFLDYCMTKINAECEPYAVRCFSLYAAAKMCVHYPELLAELEGHLELMQIQTLSPGLKSALRQTRERIRKSNAGRGDCL